MGKFVKKCKKFSKKVVNLLNKIFNVDILKINSKNKSLFHTIKSVEIYFIKWYTLSRKVIKNNS